MVQQTPSKTTNKEEFLRASINHSGFRLELSTRQTAKTLSDLRRIMECLTSVDEGVDDFTCFELSSSLSEEFVANSAAMAEIRKLINMEQQYRIIKEHISAVEEIDLVEGKKHLRVDNCSIKKAICALFSYVDKSNVRHALIHVKGLIPEHERMVIIDRVHEHISHANIRAYHTEQDIQGKVLVEALLFGDFEHEE